MGIKLDWEIEAEQPTVHGAGEDKFSRRRRRRAQFRVLFSVLIFMGIVGALVGLVWWRLHTIDKEIERALIDTVDAEVATLRVADKTSYLDIQRSASETWHLTQSATFDDYQRLKVENDVQLTGHVIGFDVDGARGRVQVEEIIDGVSYVQTWFYWRYVDEGWRHVPPDYTFWGTPETQEREGLTVRYQSVDEPVAQAVANSVESWLAIACTTFPCDGLADVTIEIVPQQGLPVAWDETRSSILQIPSPFVGRARLDRPFDTPLQINVANLLSERIITQTMNMAQPLTYSDAAFLRESAQAWLVSQFTQLDTQSYLVSSYASRYGSNVLGALFQNLAPETNLQALSAAAGVASPADLEVDWRDYLAWRLNLESTLHAQRDEANFMTLYDTRDENIATLATTRFNEPIQEGTYDVVAVQREFDELGSPTLRVVARIGESDNIVQFRLVDNTWKRIN